METTYPAIIIPNKIKNAKKVKPPLPEFNLRRPLPPTKPLLEFDIKKATIQTVSVGTPGAFAIYFPKFRPIGFGVLGAVFITLGVSIFKYRQKKKEQKQTYLLQQEKFVKRLNNFKVRETKHKDKCRQLHTPKLIQEYRKSQIYSLLQNTSPPFENPAPPKKGLSETEICKFGEIIRSYFPNKIYINKSLQNPKYDDKYPYTADFAYIDINKNLHIDIEIDEPYWGKKKKPAHYINSKKEKIRNEFFLSQGWIVIRFSEQQIFQYPHECCKIVAEVIMSIAQSSEYLNDFRGIGVLKPQKRWSKNQALEMARNNYRTTYTN